MSTQTPGTRTRNRDEQRAARARQAAKSTPENQYGYHTALNDVRDIREIAADNNWTYEAAEAWFDDPGNQVLAGPGDDAVEYIACFDCGANEQYQCTCYEEPCDECGGSDGHHSYHCGCW